MYYRRVLQPCLLLEGITLKMVVWYFEEGDVVLWRGWSSTLKRVVWYFEEGGVVFWRRWCGILKRVMWYFEDGGVVLWRGWCGSLKRVVWNFDYSDVVLWRGWSRTFFCLNGIRVKYCFIRFTFLSTNYYKSIIYNETFKSLFWLVKYIVILILTNWVQSDFFGLCLFNNHHIIVMHLIHSTHPTYTVGASSINDAMFDPVGVLNCAARTTPPGPPAGFYCSIFLFSSISRVFLFKCYTLLCFVNILSSQWHPPPIIWTLLWRPWLRP